MFLYAYLVYDSTEKNCYFLGAFLYKYFYYVTEPPSVNEARKILKYICVINAILRYMAYMYSQNNGYISMPCTVTKKNLIFWAPSYINSVYVMEPSESEAIQI